MVNVVRYADDFIVTGRSKELLEHEVKPRIEQFLRERGLELSSEKTTITRIQDGFDFLGKHIRKYRNGAVLATPSKQSVRTMLMHVRGIIKDQKALDAGTLVLLLNPIIRGWAHYHRPSAATATFRKVDHAIFQALWRWAKRRHPKKSTSWVKRKYFRTVGGRQWVFHGEHQGQTHTLFHATSIPKVRYTKVKGDANPFDPAWEIYFEQRLEVKMAQTLRGRRHLLYLWQTQGGVCPVCTEPITDLTAWHNHHIIWRSKGGTDTADNRVLLHPNCHRQVHSQGSYVQKPRPAQGDREA